MGTVRRDQEAGGQTNPFTSNPKSDIKRQDTHGEALRRPPLPLNELPLEIR
jgi:hypothetical protein